MSCTHAKLRLARRKTQVETVQFAYNWKIDGDTEGMKDVWLPSSIQIIEGSERVARIKWHQKASEARCILSLRIRRFRLNSYEL
jgi:hypothetical protein